MKGNGFRRDCEWIKTSYLRPVCYLLLHTRGRVGTRFKDYNVGGYRRMSAAKCQPSDPVDFHLWIRASIYPDGMRKTHPNDALVGEIGMRHDFDPKESVDSVFSVQSAQNHAEVP